MRFSFLIFTTPFGNYFEAEKGLKLCVSSWRRTSDNAIPPRAKVSGAYANSAIIKTDAHEAGFDDAVVLSESGQVTEGSAMNIFLVINGVLTTTSTTDDILVGVTRNTVFKTNNYYQDDAKLRNGEYNGLVPAPRPNEEDHFLKGDGTWASANDIMNTITTNPEDEGKILKAHNGSVIWASLINGEEVGY